MTAQELLEQLNLLDENERIEAKAACVFNRPLRLDVQTDTLTASQGLKKPRDAGLLQQKGRGSATWYQPTPKMLGADTGLSSNPEGLSRNLGGLSRDPNSLDKAKTEHKTEVRNALLAELPGELAARVGALGRRSPPDAVREVVLELLHLRPWRLEELGQILQRNPEYIRHRYVQPLLEARRIRMTRPDVPNDPEQAYRAMETQP
jgi:ATP-dependent DNA helicase RecG